MGLALLLVAASACFTEPAVTDPDAFVVEGRIQRLEIEGGCFVLAADGVQYEPTNLAVTFRADGLPFRAAIRPASDVTSICQVVQVVDILWISVPR